MAETTTSAGSADSAPPPSTPDVAADATAHATCRHCNTVLGSANVCPSCRRKQVRTCFCMEQIPWNADRCPSCGMDWNQLRRAQRAQWAEHRKYRRELRIALWHRILAGVVVLAVLGAAALSILLAR